MAPYRPQESNNDDIRGDIQRLLATLQENNRAAAEDRIKLSAKVDAIPDMLNQIRREQSNAISELRRDFERLFVPRAEYDPKHQVLLDKIREYDQIISDSRKSQEEWVKRGERLNNINDELNKLKGRSSALAGRILPWVALALSFASVALTYAQHISVK